MTEEQLRAVFVKRAGSFALQHPELQEWARMKGAHALVMYVFTRPGSLPWGWWGLNALRRWGGPKADQLYRELCSDSHRRIGYPAPGQDKQ